MMSKVVYIAVCVNVIHKSAAVALLLCCVVFFVSP